ncbi:MAG: preprotein translocase subunit SecE [Candidatus Magasanikbacteria bacterium RIFOXYC2_FULL_39_8]|nr:MAG: preprotein translocase subunit SecE [Candidatus Magasanikbacteria bacterium RIFOXYC2_FULL_39_8]
MNKLIKYFREAIGELKKVTWPTKKQTWSYTFVVIGMSLGIALFFMFLDWIFNLGIDIII